MAIQQQSFNPHGLYLERVGDSSNQYNEIRFTSSISRIGRANNMEICIPDGKTVSREQARISFTCGRMYVENLSQSNFTFLNDDRVVQRSEVEEGDLVGLGTRPGVRHLNQDIPECQKFVYICRRKEIEVEAKRKNAEIIVLSSDDEEEDEVATVPQNKHVTESPRKGEKIGEKEVIITVEENNNMVPCLSSSNVQSNSVNNQHLNSMQLKELRIVLYKLTQDDINRHMKARKRESSHASESSESSLSVIEVSSVSSSSSRTKETKKLKEISQNLNESPSFQSSKRFSRTQSEKLNAAKIIKEKIDKVVDADSSDHDEVPLSLRSGRRRKIPVTKKSKPAAARAFKILKMKEHNGFNLQPKFPPSPIIESTSQTDVRESITTATTSSPLRIIHRNIENATNQNAAKKNSPPSPHVQKTTSSPSNVSGFIPTIASTPQKSEKKLETTYQSNVKVKFPSISRADSSKTAQSTNGDSTAATTTNLKRKFPGLSGSSSSPSNNSKKMRTTTEKQADYQTLKTIAQGFDSNNAQDDKDNEEQPLITKLFSRLNHRLSSISASRLHKSKELEIPEPPGMPEDQEVDVSDSPVMKQRQSNYNGPSTSNVAPKIKEFDMFAKGNMMRSANNKIIKDIKPNSPHKVSKVSNNITLIKKRRMSYGGEKLPSRSSPPQEPSNRTSNLVPIPKFRGETSDRLITKASAIKVKCTSNGRGDCFTQQVALPPRRASVAQRPVDNDRAAQIMSQFRNNYVKDSNFSSTTTSDVINSNMENTHRVISTQQQIMKLNEPPTKSTSPPENVIETTKFYTNDSQTSSAKTDYTILLKAAKTKETTAELNGKQSESGSSDENQDGTKPMKSILKGKNSERRLKKVQFANDLVSVLEITPVKFDYPTSPQAVTQEAKRLHAIDRNIQVVVQSHKVKGLTLPPPPPAPGLTIAKVCPIVKPPTMNELMKGAIDDILTWDPEWLWNYDNSVKKDPKRWVIQNVECYYEDEFKYLQTLRRIAKLEVFKKMCNFYRACSRKNFVFLLTKEVNISADGRTVLLLEMRDPQEYELSSFKSGSLLLLRARNNTLVVPKDIDYLGYVVASNQKNELTVEIMTTDIYNYKTVFKAKPLMYFRSEVHQLAVIEPLHQNPILWKIIKPDKNCLISPKVSDRTSLVFPDLCAEQEVIVNALVVEDVRKRKIMVINGGPGTGKSRVMIETINYLLNQPGKRKKFLICSNSNSAVDQNAEILYNCYRQIKAIRVGNANKMTSTAFKMSLDEETKTKMNSQRGLKYRDAEREIFEATDVVLTTTMSSWRLWEYDVSYEMCFIECANQITDCELILPAQLKIKKLILIGDQSQPQHSINTPWRINQKANIPLFLRMLDYFEKKENKPIFNLTLQHRIPQEIFNYCNRQFFNNKMSMAVSSDPYQYPFKPYKVFGVNTIDMRNSKNPTCSITMTTVVLKLCSKLPRLDYTVGILAMSQTQREDITAASQFRPQRMQTLSYEQSHGIEKDVIVLIIMEKDIPLANEYLHTLMTRAKIAVYIFTELCVINNNRWRGNLQEFHAMAENSKNYHAIEVDYDVASLIKK